ncbi:MAG: glutaredoxin family protein [Candidatus Bathyarchaeota archaeon]
MDKIKVEGKNSRHKVLLYAISTCPWCNKEKKLLKDNNIEFEYVDVDLCSDEDYEEIKKDIIDRGGRFSFPALIVNDKILINGFKEKEIMEALEK